MSEPNTFGTSQNTQFKLW